MVRGLEEFHSERKDRGNSQSSMSRMPKRPFRNLLNERVRIEKVAIKDAKLRTFITQDSDRNELVAHVYDITYGTIRRG